MLSFFKNKYYLYLQNTAMEFAFIYYVDLNTITMFFCAAFLFATHGNKLPNSILSYTFSFAGIFLILQSILNERAPVLLSIEKTTASTAIDLFTPYSIMGALLIIPAIYFYLFHLMQAGYITMKRVSIAYGPTLALILFYIFVITSQGKLPPMANFIELELYWFSSELLIRGLLYFILLIELLSLAFTAFKIYKTHSQGINDNFSYMNGASLKWVPVAIIAITCYGVSLFCSGFKPYPFEAISSFIFAFLSIYISLKVVRQNKLYEDPIVPKTMDSPSFRDERMKQIKAQLLEKLEKNEIYKDPELSLDKVCSILATNRNYLYQIIKNDLDTSFYDLINSYRLKHALSLLEKPEYAQMKIVLISEIVGFKNVSSFITLFKKRYNTTPNEWRSSHLL